MYREVRAVIDVGTNSVKLLVGDVDGAIVRPLHEASHQTRLGQGFYETRVLQPAAIDETAKAVADFVLQARSWEPARLKIVATSAARDALNQEELLTAITAASGHPVVIISGEQEADWAYRGVTTDPQIARKNLLVMDVGGGSTEFILGQGDHRIFSQSFSIGSVRLLERLSISDPPSESERIECERQVRTFLEQYVQPQLSPKLAGVIGPFQLVGTGGTSTILARIQLRLRSFRREMIEGTLLSHSDVKSETLRLWSTPLEQRKRIIGLPPNRADVILMGAMIFEQVMQTFGLASLQVSTRGLRFAALMD